MKGSGINGGCPRLTQVGERTNAVGPAIDPSSRVRRQVECYRVVVAPGVPGANGKRTDFGRGNGSISTGLERPGCIGQGVSRAAAKAAGAVSIASRTQVVSLRAEAALVRWRALVAAGQVPKEDELRALQRDAAGTSDHRLIVEARLLATEVRSRR